MKNKRVITNSPLFLQNLLVKTRGGERKWAISSMGSLMPSTTSSGVPRQTKMKKTNNNFLLNYTKQANHIPMGIFSPMVFCSPKK
ncbi:MAG: hypothetical protein JW840_09205 [Candidatus Thermoplasmatota archaeon]|nr:hypothetical protein [Candidatus Thermoplasmatota archaeon]